MNKVICICGKICSGKTTYAQKLALKEKAIILSIDEVTFELIDNQQGPFYDELVKKINKYLKKKAVEIVASGANVILDWGFWSAKDRQEINLFFKNNKINYEWHYLQISDELWHEYIKKRNQEILNKQNIKDFYITDGLFKKFISLFEEPDLATMDVIYSKNN